MDFRRIMNAFGFSMKGLHVAWKTEVAFKQEVVVFLTAILVALSIDFSLFERFFLLGSLLLIIIIELLNSALEAVVDRIGTEYHELSGRAKDYGSAAVLLTIVQALVIWISIFIRHFC